MPKSNSRLEYILNHSPLERRIIQFAVSTRLQDQNEVIIRVVVDCDQRRQTIRHKWKSEPGQYVFNMSDRPSRRPKPRRIPKEVIDEAKSVVAMMIRFEEQPDVTR